VADVTSRDWVSWAQTDPHLAVMGYLPDGEPWQTDAFYESGAAEWPAFLKRWREFGMNAEGSVLDLGCGAGRITAQLATVFPEVVGVDVSPIQLDLARRAVGDVTPASFHVSDGSRIPLPDEAVSNVFSANVFQHLAQPVAEALIVEVARVLAPGGSAMIHIPVPGSNLTTTSVRVLAQRIADPVRVVVHRARSRFVGYPPMRQRVYDAGPVLSLIDRVGLIEPEMRLFNTVPDGMFSSFFFARKPEQQRP
jgi:SAM-dependent methyltransferase